MSVVRARRLFTVDDYHRMIEAGILGEDDRVELIEGEIVTMSPIGPPHAWYVDRLALLLFLALGVRAIVRVQNPIELRPLSEPQPDLALLRPRSYLKRHPRAKEVLLAIEVADSSLLYDRNTKVPLYAAKGIRETWVVDIRKRVVEVYRNPTAGGYKTKERRGRGDTLTIAALPGVKLKVDEIFRD